MNFKLTAGQKDMLRETVLPIAASLASGTAFSKFLNVSTTNIFTLIFFILLYFFYKTTFQITDRKVIIVSYLCGSLYTASFVLVKLSTLLADERPGYAAYVAFFYVIGFFLFFGNLLVFLYSRFMEKDFCLDEKTKRPDTLSRKAILYGSSMLLMLLAWLPYFLRNFPGDVTTDSHDELEQAVGAAPYSNHHPIAHTMMIRLFYNLGMLLFNDQTMAVATYSVCQAILLSAAFSYLLITLYKFRVKRGVILAVLAFYTVIPYHGVYSVTMWKDIWFGGIVVVLSTTIWRLIRYYRQKPAKLPWFELIMLFVFGTAMCLFRSNGLYAYILLVPFLCLIFLRKSFMPILFSMMALMVAFMVKGPVYNSMGVTPPDTIESLSIPAQHIARAIKDGAVLTTEEEELLSNVVDIQQIPERYAPSISDPIKNLVRETDNQAYIDEHKMEFLKLWVDLGISYPKSYILAQIDQTYGYWYPDVQYWLYSGEFRGSGSGYEIHQDRKLSESAAESVTKYMQSYKDITYWGLFWSIGTASWICAFMFGLCFLKRHRNYLVVYIPVLAVLATLMIATPVFAEFRYAYSVFTTVPLLCIVPFCATPKDKAAEASTPVKTDSTENAPEKSEVEKHAQPAKTSASHSKKKGRSKKH